MQHNTSQPVYPVLAVLALGYYRSPQTLAMGDSLETNLPGSYWPFYAAAQHSTAQ